MNFRTLTGLFLAVSFVVASGTALFSAPAGATLIWNLDENQCSEGPGIVCTAGFDATATFEFSNIDANSIDVQVTVANDSSVVSAHLSAFGFSVLPGLTADADGTNDDAVADGALPAGWFINLGGQVLGFLDAGSPTEVCISLKDGNCFGTSGNPAVVANSIDPGEELVFNLILDNLNDDGTQAFATALAYEDAFGDNNPIFFRFKPLDENDSDLGGAGSVKFGGLLQGTDVPEPGALALIGIGLAGLGFARRRRKIA